MGNLDQHVERSKFIVLRSDSPLCVYKRLPGLAGDLMANVFIKDPLWHQRIGNVLGGAAKPMCALSILPVDWKENIRYSHYVNYQTVELLIPADMPVVGALKQNDSNYYIKFGNEDRMLPVEWIRSRSQIVRLIEENGEYFYEAYGTRVLWPVINAKSVNLPNLLSSINSLPWGRKPRVEEDIMMFVKWVMSKYESVVCQAIVDECAIDLGKLNGVGKAFTKVRPLFENLLLTDDKVNPDKLEWSIGAYIFKGLMESSGRVVSSMKISTVINKEIEQINTDADMRGFCRRLISIWIDSASYFNVASIVEKLVESNKDLRDKKKEMIKKKSTGAFNKIMEDLDFVKIDQARFPITHEAVHSGAIPLGTFFRKSDESYFMFNDNWELWEEMLAKHREEAIAIAETCSGRTTYEKDLMSYFYFTLRDLPAYLKQHTGKDWIGLPKLVNSSEELEPPKEGSNGVAKSRSALTPIVDNEACTVTVPYVSMRVSGMQTTYCYGLSYSVLRTGFTYNGNVVTKDCEVALNGRDDYGLMFYTLTGTAQGRGYPTFLIIFERLERGKTRVHFHRTHPMRSKNKEYNPVHNWTVGAYKWMSGNVNFERIVAQQGDLIFVAKDGVMPDVNQWVHKYDNHCFDTLVRFHPIEGKENILGLMHVKEDNWIRHPEHLDRRISANLDGQIYEVRQARSWEANPKGIWSLRID